MTDDDTASSKQIRNSSKLARVVSKWAFLLRHLTRSGRKTLKMFLNSLFFPLVPSVCIFFSNERMNKKEKQWWVERFQIPQMTKPFYQLENGVSFFFISWLEEWLENFDRETHEYTFISFHFIHSQIHGAEAQIE